MYLYLVQHGEAKPKEEDRERPLTVRGAEDVRRVGQFAKRAGARIAEIRHSGKKRAEQTATILEECLRPPRGAVAYAGLDPQDDVEPLAEALEEAGDDLMIAGHLPQLSRLASCLLVGDPEREVVRFQLGGMVCLERFEKAAWRVAWMVTPELL